MNDLILFLLKLCFLPIAAWFVIFAALFVIGFFSSLPRWFKLAFVIFCASIINVNYGESSQNNTFIKTYQRNGSIVRSHIRKKPQAKKVIWMNNNAQGLNGYHSLGDMRNLKRYYKFKKQ